MNLDRTERFGDLIFAILISQYIESSNFGMSTIDNTMARREFTKILHILESIETEDMWWSVATVFSGKAILSRILDATRLVASFIATVQHSINGKANVSTGHSQYGT
jgi:hypothetical protein